MDSKTPTAPSIHLPQTNRPSTGKASIRIAVMLAGTLIASPLFAGKPTITPIVYNGMPAPGGGNFQTYLSDYSMNSHGQAVFSASVGGVNSLWLHSNGSLTPAAQFLRPYLIYPGYSILSSGDYHSPSINNAGEVAFIFEFYERAFDGVASQEVWTGAPGSLTLMAKGGEPAPGTNDNYTGHFGYVMLNDAGQVLIQQTEAFYSFPRQSGLWLGSPSSPPALIAYHDRAFPGVSATFASLDPAILSNTGQVLFMGLENPVAAHKVGLWLATPGNITPLALHDTPAPGTESVFDEGGFFRPTISPTGRIAFAGETDNGTTMLGIWYQEPGEPLQLLVSQRIPAPGTTESHFQYLLSSPVSNSAGQLAFTAELDDGGPFAGTIWSGTPDDLHLLVKAGQPAPGTAPGVVFDAMWMNPQINEVGQVAFAASDVNPDVPGPTGSGVWLANPDGTILPLIHRGDLLEFDGAAHEVSDWHWSYTTSPTINEFTNNGEVLVYLQFTDGQSGLFLIGAVPEPTSLAPLAAACLLLRPRRRQI